MPLSASTTLILIVDLKAGAVVVAEVELGQVAVQIIPRAVLIGADGPISLVNRGQCCTAALLPKVY
jgi:hypothetical protein